MDPAAEVSKTQTEGETFKTSISSAISIICPPLFEFARLFGSDEILWITLFVLAHLIFYATSPRSLLFLLPIPLVYLLPMYATMAALSSTSTDMAKQRTLWLSYWSVIGFVDLGEMVLLGSIGRVLGVWPLLKTILALFLMSESPSTSIDPHVPASLMADQKRYVSAERRKMQARGDEKGKIDEWRKAQSIKDQIECKKSMVRVRRYHCFAIVEPFLPSQAYPGGPNINLRRDGADKPEIDPKTGKPKKTDEEKREEDRAVNVRKWELEREGAEAGQGLGNWAQPIMDHNGEIVDHNPTTDQYGNILDKHKHGRSGQVVFGTPWDNDPNALDAKAGLPFSEAPLGQDPTRPTGGRRIHILPDVAWREYATDPGESTALGDADPWVNAQRDLGLGFAGYKNHPTTEVAQLDDIRMKLDSSVDWEMRKRTIGASSHKG